MRKNEEVLLEFKKMGPKGFQVFYNRLNKGRLFFDALNTDIGKQLFKENAQRLNELHEKLIKNAEVTPEEKGEILLLRQTLIRWVGKLEKYIDDSDKFQKYEEFNQVTGENK